MRVLICVTHLLGTGHLSRALTLARAFSDAGHEAHVLSGGGSVETLSTGGITFHQLPPVKSDGVNFTTLLDGNGDEIDDTYLARRKAQVVGLLSKISFDVVITELYPFGRRVLKGEFLSVLNATRLLKVKPVVLGSVRDILAPPSKPKKALETEAVVGAYYDGILVHSEQSLTPLEVSWPVTDMLREKLFYTGFVAPAVVDVHPDGVGLGEVLVTAGGGSVGMPLFESAVKAAAQDPNHVWRILVGGAEKEKQISALERLIQSENVIIEPTRPDFRQMLARADAAICMCGYNTAMDLLQSGTRAVFVPFDAGGEVEQTLRAQSLAQQDGYVMVKASDASAERLIEGLKQVRKHNPTPYDPSLFQGAQGSVKIVERLVAERDG